MHLQKSVQNNCDTNISLLQALDALHTITCTKYTKRYNTIYQTIYDMLGHFIFPGKKTQEKSEHVQYLLSQPY